MCTAGQREDTFALGAECEPPHFTDLFVRPNLLDCFRHRDAGVRCLQRFGTAKDCTDRRYANSIS